ncbi:uncharacterized protein [Watersipora subatra]|uniref:uncharacterized protein n=1 Tax=Watersipora subatra TaxID=2589382 RepID=UPI00355B0AB0
MGNISDKDTQTEICDGEFYYDNISQPILTNNNNNNNEKADSVLTNENSASFKRTDWSRKQVSRSSVHKKKLPPKKALGRRRSSTIGVLKKKRSSKFLLADLKVTVEDGKIAKLVPRDSVIDQKALPNLRSTRPSSLNIKESLEESDIYRKVREAQKKRFTMIPSSSSSFYS